MARVRFHDGSCGTWQTFAQLTPPHLIDRFSGPELSSTIFVHELGDEDTPQLTEVRYLPNVAIDLHAHDEDEIFFILGGEMRMGSRLLTPGCSAFVKRDTLYSLTAGDEGAHFLVFR